MKYLIVACLVILFIFLSLPKIILASEDFNFSLSDLKQEKSETQLYQFKTIDTINFDQYLDFLLEQQKLEKAKQESLLQPFITYSFPVVSPIELEGFFTNYASIYNLDANKLKAIAKCESGFNPLALNGIYGGLFQFAPATWVSNRKALGQDEDTNLRFNAEEAIETAVYKISRDGTSAWPVCQYQ
ncbi:transglycosylase family protein [Candidatus Beckwithbacteria bacterium]|nr:transglycosylase family protein [Candidatus Beckwithbacteria bacterium]